MQNNFKDLLVAEIAHLGGAFVPAWKLYEFFGTERLDSWLWDDLRDRVRARLKAPTLGIFRQEVPGGWWVGRSDRVKSL